MLNTSVSDDKKCQKASGYLEAALEQVFACDDVRDFCLIQSVSDGHGSECGVQGHNYQLQTTFVTVTEKESALEIFDFVFT